MKVYVETNWLLDLTLKQERIQASSFVVELAKKGQIHLCMPDISLIEADQKIVRRRLQRDELIHKCKYVKRFYLIRFYKRYDCGTRSLHLQEKRQREKKVIKFPLASS